MTDRFSFFAACPPGLEDLTRAELFALGINHPRAVPGGVEFTGFLSHLYRVNLWSRGASRVLLRLGAFEAKGFDELHRKAAALPWSNFLKPEAALTVRATCHKSRLYHSDAVAERVARAVGERLKAPSAPGDGVHVAEAAPGAGVVVRLDHDHCTISLDSSGAHLHQRGYRLQTAKAPLRESLAAALLLHAGYDPAQPLLDPFCGSGTFAIEAALIARNLPPGRMRRFAFMDWANFDASEWSGLLHGAQGLRRESPAAPLLASDRDAGAVAAARANAERAGVLDAIQLNVAAVSAIVPPPGPGLVIANLPYGRRVGADVRDAYAQFGHAVREKCGGWRAAFVAGNLALAKQTRLPLGEPLWIENGGLRVPFLLHSPA